MRLQIVDHRRVGAVLNPSFAIAEITEVARLGVIEIRLHIEIVQFGVQRTLLVVVIKLSSVENKFLNGQIKQVGVATALLLWFWQIVLTSLVDEDVDHRMIDDDVLNAPGAAKERQDFDSYIDVISLQQRPVGIFLSAVDGNSIEIKAEIAQMKMKVADLKPRARGFLHAALYFGQYALAESLVVLDHQDGRHHYDNNQQKNSGNAPANDLFPLRPLLIRLL